MAYIRQQQHGPGRPVEIEDREQSISPRPLDSPSERNRSLPDALDMIFNDRISQGNASSRQAVAFMQLPTEIISRILWLVDADSFASLCLLNKKWYLESQKLELYAHHLSRCPSFALSNNVITGPFRRNDLFRLKTKFAAEVRRNLFSAYLRPRETLINIISIGGVSSSTAFPGGEAFRFTFSPNGQTLLALSSSRIFVIDVTSDPPAVRKELKTLRRPISASVTDDGSLLAVLSTKHQANVYGLTTTEVKHLQVIVLDNPPRTIALAHEGTVLAAAYETGVEVFSLAANALSTDRRAVRCEAVDSLNFSGDGSMLVGSSQNPDDPSTVVISAPFYAENDPDLTARELHSRQWTTQILFPNNSASISHAALIPNHPEGDATWLFAFDHMLNTYRAVRTDDTRTGVAYFLSPSWSRRFSFPFPSNAPSTTACGDLVVAGFHGLGLWLYGIPERLDLSPDMGSVVERNETHMRGRFALTSATGNPEPLMAYSPSVSGSSESIEEDGLAGKVDWRQSLFVKCKRLKSVDGTTEARWVERSESTPGEFLGNRLIAVAPGGVSGFGEDLGDEQAMPVDGGRIVLLDFDYAPSKRPDQELTIEVGLNPPQLLEEHHGNLDIEVAMERRRTVRLAPGRGRGRAVLGRSVTAIAPSTGVQTYLQQQNRRGSASNPSSPSENTLIGQDIGSPYMPSQPRNQDNIQRSATAAGLYRSRFPPRPPLGTPQPNGRRDSNDSWESPPPPYSPPPPAPEAQMHPAWRNAISSPSPRQLPSPVISPVSTLGSPMMQAQPHQALQAPSPPSTRAPTWIKSSPDPPMQTPSPGSTLQPTSGPLMYFPHPVLTPPIRNFTDPIQRVSEPFHSPPRAQTSFERTAIPEIPPSRFGYQPSVYRPFRPKVYSDTTLATVAELSSFHQAMNGIQFSPPHSASATSSPVSTPEPSYFARRRPVSHDGSSRLSGIPLNLSATLSHPVSPPTPEQEAQKTRPPDLERFQRLENLSPPAAIHDRQISLSGANLQNRLNHPTPPTPTAEEQARDTNYIPPKLQVGQPAAPTMLPPNGNVEPFTLAPPTADQMANLNRRVSQSRLGPLAVQTNGNYANGSATHDFGRVPPSPPRAAWGAAGVPGSPSFNKAINTPQGLQRSDSRASQRSITLSASVPNLLAQRPRYGRMDTIESVQSAYAETQQGLRSRSHSLQQSMVSPIQDERLYVDSRAYAPEPKLDRKRKKEKKNKKLQNGTFDATGDERGKKGSRCVVM